MRTAPENLDLPPPAIGQKKIPVLRKKNKKWAFRRGSPNGFIHCGCTPAVRKRTSNVVICAIEAFGEIDKTSCLPHGLCHSLVFISTSSRAFLGELPTRK